MNDSSDDLLDALTPVVKEFERLGVRYYVGGSAASSNYGVARSTLDVDLVADLLGTLRESEAGLRPSLGVLDLRPDGAHGRGGVVQLQLGSLERERSSDELAAGVSGVDRHEERVRGRAAGRGGGRH